MKRLPPFAQVLLGLLLGIAGGLAYAWLISPVTYVDASPALLRADFKDQYRLAIADAYASNHSLDRARARLQLLGDADLIGAISAQAQRMVASGDSLERIQPLALLAADLQNGAASIPPTLPPQSPTPYAGGTPLAAAIETFTPEAPPSATEEQAIPETSTPVPSATFEATVFAPPSPAAVMTFAPRPTFTPVPPPAAPFLLTDQATICNPIAPGLLQFMLTDARRKQIAGIEVVITSPDGEDHTFTGFKPELGNGYADFQMQAGTVYSVRVTAGGAFVPDLSAPDCRDGNGVTYPGSLLLTFQQP